MIEKKITAANADEKIKQLYQTAFPEEEQISWNDLQRLISKMPLDFTAYYDGDELAEQQEQSQTCFDFAESRRKKTKGQFIGFTIVYPRKSFNWFWYFAVREELRGKGYGQQILTQLIERYKDKANILDIESPDQPCDNLEQRKHRHGFYLRNGFRDTHVCRTYEGITYTIMMMGEGTFTQQDYDDIIQELQQFWWPNDVAEDN